MERKHQSGQVGLIILVISAVLLTVGLGVSSQSILETKHARQETESSQTFNVAEQGVEEALSSLTPTTGTVPGNLPAGFSANYTVATANALTSKLIDPGDVIEINLRSYSNTLVLTWASQSCSTGLIVTLYKGTATSTNLNRYAVGCTNVARTDQFSAPSASCVNTGSGYTCSHTISAADINGSMFARVKVLYNQASISVTGGAALPAQGYDITSNAQRQGSLEARTLKVFKSNAAAVSLLDYAVISGNGIVHSAP